MVQVLKVEFILLPKAIDHPGTSAELYTGDLRSRGLAVRHAHANESKTFGYKINVNTMKEQILD